MPVGDHSLPGFSRLPPVVWWIRKFAQHCTGVIAIVDLLNAVHGGCCRITDGLGVIRVEYYGRGVMEKVEDSDDEEEKISGQRHHRAARFGSSLGWEKSVGRYRSKCLWRGSGGMQIDCANISRKAALQER